MEEKIEETRKEFNAILDYVLQKAIGQEIHEVERSIYRMLLALGRLSRVFHEAVVMGVKLLISRDYRNTIVL